MALISLVVLFAVQACWFAVLTVQRPHHDAEGYARGLMLVLAGLGMLHIRKTRVADLS